MVSEASEVGVSPPNERNVCGAERSGAKDSEQKDRVDAVASGIWGSSGRRCQRGLGSRISGSGGSPPKVRLEG